MHKGYVAAAVIVALSALFVGCSSSSSMGLPTADAPISISPVAPLALTSVPQASPSGLRAVSTPRYTTNDDPHMIAASVRPKAAAVSSFTPPVTPINASTSSRDLKVMTFNLRVATAFDLTNTWDLRRGMVVERIRAFDPDMLGTQEGLEGMENYLQDKLTEYTFFGVGRNDGKDAGEMCGIFYKTSKFDQLDGGHFWLSQNPEKPGTKGWGAWFPRMVTWVKLRPRASVLAGRKFPPGGPPIRDRSAARCLPLEPGPGPANAQPSKWPPEDRHA